MPGRIRTLKPEWLDDEKLRACSCQARVLSVGLILLADDHGRGRASFAWLSSNIFHFNEDILQTDSAMRELVSVGFVRTYEVRDQHYFEIVNWKKHQRVDKPGKPRVPPPEEASVPENRDFRPQPRHVYFIRGDMTGLIKIGESIDPVARLTELAKCGSERLQLLAIVANGSGTERELHTKLASDRVHGEWFRPSDAVVAEIEAAGGKLYEPIATAGYDGRNRLQESFRNDSGFAPESFRPDLRPRPTTNDQDLASSQADKPKRPSAKKDKPEPTAVPGYKELVEHYFLVFESCRKTKPCFGSREGKAIRDLLELCGGSLDRAKAVVTNAYADTFWREKATILSIAKDPSQFLTGMLQKTNGSKPDDSSKSSKNQVVFTLDQLKCPPQSAT